MHVIYYCYGSAHSSISAAAIHLGRLPDHDVPAVEKIMRLADFDRSLTGMIGFLYYKGQDAQGHHVYTTGFGHEHQLVRQVFTDILRLNGQDLRQYCLIGALPSLHVYGLLGGLLSRRYGWVKMGRRLAAMGIQKSYPKLVALVNKTKQSLT